MKKTAPSTSSKSTKKATTGCGPAAALIDARIESLGDWRGAALARVRALVETADPDDPSGLFNASLEGKVRRAIDLREGEKHDEKAFASLVRAAVALNMASARR